MPAGDNVITRAGGSGEPADREASRRSLCVCPRAPQPREPEAPHGDSHPRSQPHPLSPLPTVPSGPRRGVGHTGEGPPAPTPQGLQESEHLSSPRGRRACLARPWTRGTWREGQPSGASGVKGGREHAPGPLPRCLKGAPEPWGGALMAAVTVTARQLAPRAPPSWSSGGVHPGHPDRVAVMHTCQHARVLSVQRGGLSHHSDQAWGLRGLPAPLPGAGVPRHHVH